MVRLLLVPLTLSFSSFITALFLIQIPRWIRGSSRIEFIIFLITRGIFSFSHLLFSYYKLRFFLCALFPDSTEGNHFLLAHIHRMNESHDPGRPLKAVITISYSSSIASNFSSLIMGRVSSCVCSS